MDSLIAIVIVSIIIGAVLGGLARMLLPGTQRIGMLLTVIAGAVAAFGGHLIAEQFGWHSETGIIDWPKLGIQVLLAMVVIGVIGGVGRRSY